MIIKKVILQDFFRYYGTQEIDCKIDENKNVIVIIGENGRGKTTLLTAFNWVFYNEIIKPLTLGNLLNYRKCKELNIGENAEASVTIFFEEDRKEYKIYRKVNFIKGFTGNVSLVDNKGQENIFRIEENGDETELNYTLTTEKLLIPKDLRGFFFFDGEHISRLAKVDGKKEIKNAILNVLGISYLDQTNNDLNSIRKNLMDKLKRYSTNTENENNIIWRHTELEKEIGEIESEIIDVNDQLNDSTNTLEELNSIMSKSDDTVVKELEEKNNNLIIKIDENSKRLIDIERNIKKHITSNFKYYLMHDYVDDVEKILEQKRKEGRLPSNIKETFIDDLINRGKCICGTCLKEGTEEYDYVLALKQQAGSRELDDAYYDLKNLIKIIKEQFNNFYSNLNDLTSGRDILKRNIYLDKEESKIISEKLNNSDSESIQKASQSRIILKEAMEKLTKRLGVLEDKLKEKKNEEISLEKRLKLITSNNKVIENIKRKIEVTENLLKLNSDFRNMFIEVVREELDVRIKAVFSKITSKDYRVPILTKEFELKIISKINQDGINDKDKKEEVLSTGEGQITSLSFIGALVSYAKDTKDDIILSKLMGADYPIVMDSPFGNLDEIHTTNVAANIGKLGSQVIIVVSQKQWEGYVEENIKNQVIRTYKMIDGEGVYNNGEYTEIRKVGN